MSDDKPSEAPRREQWSAEDRRILVITIAGGLAANLGTVLIVGLGLAYLHHQRSKGVSAPAVVGAAGILAVISAAVLVPVIIFWIRGEAPRPVCAMT